MKRPVLGPERGLFLGVDFSVLESTLAITTEYALNESDIHRNFTEGLAKIEKELKRKRDEQLLGLKTWAVKELNKNNGVAK